MDVFIYQMGLLTFICSLQIGGKKSSKLVSMMLQEGPCSLWGKKGRRWRWLGSSQGQRRFHRRTPLAQAYWDSFYKHHGLIVFAVNVTLDEATAHPRLLLTEDRRGVILAGNTARSTQLHTEICLHSLCAGSATNLFGEILLGGGSWGPAFLGPGSL